MKDPRKDNLAAKVASEGYCCINGYLRLCKARNEKVPDMAKWIGLHRYTIYYHYRELAANRRPCMKQGDCMSPLISEITLSSQNPAALDSPQPSPFARDDTTSTEGNTTEPGHKSPSESPP